MKKKLLMIVMAMVLCFALAACGGGGDKEKDDGIDPNATVTKEQYDELSDSKWYEMSPEEMEQFLGVKYVEDEESTKDWEMDTGESTSRVRMMIPVFMCCLKTKMGTAT